MFKKHCGRGAIIMMKLNKKVLNSSLVILLALGLGGCATNSATTTHKTHEASSAQVVKQSSHKKSDNKSAKNVSEKSSSAASQASTSTKSANAATKNSSVTSSSTTVSSSSSNANVTAPSKSTSQSSNVNQNQTKQLGLGDVASWTDSKGVTHHVDSDGMDRYTTKGSSQVQYQDFSGSLPSEAVISHQN